MLDSLLSHLDIAPEETTAYLKALEVGPTTAGNLAKILGLPRPSLYGFLHRLQEKGLIIESLNSQGTKVFAAEPPEKVSFLFDQKVEGLQQQRSLYQELLPELRSRQGDSPAIPHFQVFEGEAGVRHVLKDMLLYHNLTTYSFWPIKAMVEILSADFFRYLNKERIRNNLYTRAIWPASQIVPIKDHPYLGWGKEFKREIRVAPAKVDFSLGYWIYGSRIAFVSSRRECAGFIIESREMAEMLLTQHQLIWNLSVPLEFDEKSVSGFIDELK